MIARPMLRRQAPPSGWAGAQRMSVVSRVPSDPEEHIIYHPAMAVDTGHFPRAIPPERSNFQPIKGGPIGNAILRRWYWGWNRHREVDAQAFTEVRSTAPSSQPFRSGMAPRSRFTSVLRVPAYPTSPQELTQT